MTMRAGTVGGLPLRARGVLLDHRAAAYGVAEAREAPRCRLRIPAVRDWALDYSEPGALWALTEHAWYRCAALCLLRRAGSACPSNRHGARCACLPPPL